MKIDEVTVLDVDGQLLASGSDSIEDAPDNLLALEKNVARDIRDSDHHDAGALSEHAQLPGQRRRAAQRRQDADQRDRLQSRQNAPNARVRVVKEKPNSQNTAGAAPAGVQTNLPKPQNSSADNKQSNDATDKKEELTNYEISSKSDHDHERRLRRQGLSVAVLINRAALRPRSATRRRRRRSTSRSRRSSSSSLPPPACARSAATTSRSSVVDFVDAGKDLEPVAPPSYLEILERQTGTIVSAVAILLVGRAADRVRRQAAHPGAARARRRRPPATRGRRNSARCESRSATTPHGATRTIEPAHQVRRQRDPLLEALRSARQRAAAAACRNSSTSMRSTRRAILKQWIRQGASG